jgi:hypothetical protein
MKNILRKLLILLWILGILFPMAWSVRFSPLAHGIFEWLFSPAWMHIVMHGLLYAVLAYLLRHWLDHAASQRTAGWRLALVLGSVVGVVFLHEGLQVMSAQRSFGSGEWFDLGIDLGGALLGILLYQGIKIWRVSVSG